MCSAKYVPHLFFQTCVMILQEWNVIKCQNETLKKAFQMSNLLNNECRIIYMYFFGAFLSIIQRTAEATTGIRVRERGSDTQQRASGWNSNPGPLQRGQSLCTWDARSTNWAKRRSECRIIFNSTELVLGGCQVLSANFCSSAHTHT